MSNIANTTQILGTFASLSDEELLALSHAAVKLIGGTQYAEPSDLIHEALHRALDGRRNWPMHVNFGAFVNMTMRSISNSERRSAKRPNAVHISIDEYADLAYEDQLHTKSAEDCFIEIEQIRIAQRAADAARVALVDDDDALRVLSGLMAGMSAKEMRKEFKLDPKSFDAARHRVMRRIANGDHGRPN